MMMVMHNAADISTMNHQALIDRQSRLGVVSHDQVGVEGGGGGLDGALEHLHLRPRDALLTTADKPSISGQPATVN